MTNAIFTMEHSARRVRWIEDTSVFRFVGFADEINSFIKHTGWFTDDDGMSGETLRGAVFQLPAIDGETRFLAGYIDPNNDGAALIDMEIETEKEDSARHADSLAEFSAENEREHNRHWQASRDIEDKREEIASARVRHSHNVRNYGEHGTAKHVSAVLHDDSATQRDTVSTLHSEIKELFEILPNGEIVE